MFASIAVKNDILPLVGAEIKSTAQSVLSDAGALFYQTAYSECPVSSVNTPGYVHLRDSIGYEVETEALISQSWVAFYAIKSYAQFVNDGTSRMKPRPFFTNGLLAVNAGIDALIERAFYSLKQGRSATQGFTGVASDQAAQNRSWTAGSAGLAMQRVVKPAVVGIEA